MSDGVVDTMPPEQAAGELQPVEAAANAGGAPSWLDQDGTLRDMWLQNRTPQMIAEALNRSVPAIMTRAARLGLPRRAAPGRKPGRRMPGAEQQDGQVQTRTIRSDAARRGAARMAAAPLNEAPVTSLRICLMCLHKFESAGRHNRICPTCKSSAEYESASALADIHITAG